MTTARHEEASWRLLAACSPETAHLFFPADGHDDANRRTKRERVQSALALCARCPVRAECLAHAIETSDRDAILGGTTPEQRRGMRRPHRGVALMASRSGPR